tara:strand:- start:1374 stop:1820 length:447 start_codon:yes stop_codon:yes gene_type:complete
MRVALSFLVFLLASTFALADDEYSFYTIDTYTTPIRLPFKDSDVLRMKEDYADVVGAITSCSSFDGGWLDLPSQREVDVGVVPGSGACRISLEMKGVRSYQCAFTKTQASALGEAMKAYTSGNKLPSLYAPAVLDKLYSGACEIRSGN